MSAQIRYTPKVLAANSTTTIAEAHGLGRFLCTAPGNITLTDGNGVAQLSAFPVTAGMSLDLQMLLQGNIWTITLAGGAAGTLLYW